MLLVKLFEIIPNLKESSTGDLTLDFPASRSMGSELSFFMSCHYMVLLVKQCKETDNKCPREHIDARMYGRTYISGGKKTSLNT